jgi:hypothetical protein
MLPPAILLFEELPGLPIEPFPFLPMVPVPFLPAVVVPVRVVPGLPPLVEVWFVFAVGPPFVCPAVVGLAVEGRAVLVCGAAGFGGADSVFGFCCAAAATIEAPSRIRTDAICKMFLLFKRILIASSWFKFRS